MNMHFAPHGLNFPIPRVAPRPAMPVPAAAKPAPRAGWMDRLTAWAERQPVHHHAGSWERFR